MPVDPVVEYLSQRLEELGFNKKGKRFVKKLAEATASIEIQNSSFGKEQHFIDLTVDFDPDVAAREGLEDCFAAWARVESLRGDRKLANLGALDCSTKMPEDERHRFIDEMLLGDLDEFLSHWSSFEQAERHYRTSSEKHAPINHELAQRWGR